MNWYPPTASRYFDSRFESNLDTALGRANLAERFVAKQYSDQYATKALSDHPDFLHLQPGQRVTTALVTLFVDLCDFTARSAFSSLEEMYLLRRAILLPLIQIAEDCGGHVQDIPGDGILCYFGRLNSSAPVDLALATVAVTRMFSEVERSLNPLLRARGIDVVELTAGMDYGKVLFAHMGLGNNGRVQAEGPTINFSAKLESHAEPWQVRVGEGYHDWALPQYVEAAGHLTFRDGRQVKTYSQWNLKWRQLVRFADEQIVG